MLLYIWLVQRYEARDGLTKHRSSLVGLESLRVQQPAETADSHQEHSWENIEFHFEWMAEVYSLPMAILTRLA